MSWRDRSTLSLSDNFGFLLFFVFVIILPYLRVLFIVADIIAPIIYQLNVVFLTL